jgi:hypothetical protein
MNILSRMNLLLQVNFLSHINLLTQANLLTCSLNVMHERSDSHDELPLANELFLYRST